MKTIALDIGNVCLTIHPERCFGALGYRSLAEIPQEIHHLAGELFERGRISETEFLEEFRRLSGSKHPAETLHAAFRAIIGDPLPGMNELVASLPERGFRLVFFSDTSSLHLDEVRKKFPAASVVPNGIYSFETGAKKPEPGMFEAFERRYGAPDFYFDDRADLIEGALRHGWNAHRFIDAAGMAEALKK